MFILSLGSTGVLEQDLTLPTNIKNKMARGPLEENVSGPGFLGQPGSRCALPGDTTHVGDTGRPL